ncbi:MAG: transposase [Chitinophagaceae bacterium]
MQGYIHSSPNFRRDFTSTIKVQGLLLKLLLKLRSCQRYSTELATSINFRTKIALQKGGYVRLSKNYSHPVHNFYAYTQVSDSKFIHAIHRRKKQNASILFPQSLDQIIGPGNEIGIIDLFVESINLEDFHLVMKTTKEGRPAYHPKDLLNLFVYGYLNHIRSSRQLEKECHRNMELV